MQYLLIALGGALGSVARYWCANAIAARVDGHLPWGTIVVNVIGSFLIGVTLAVIEPGGRFSFATREQLSHFLVVGFLGGYTTFSAFSAQTLDLLRAHQWWFAGANVLISVIACLVAVALGFFAASMLSR